MVRRHGGDECVRERMVLRYQDERIQTEPAGESLLIDNGPGCGVVVRGRKPTSRSHDCLACSPREADCDRGGSGSSGQIPQ